MTTTKFIIEALAPERLQAIRAAGIDDAGNAFTTRQAVGGEPLRCCLRLARSGESIILIAYCPFDRSGPYSETGPVFVHAVACPGYASKSTYPEEFLDRPQVFRCYDAAGTIVGGRFVAPGELPESVIADLFSVETVDRIHTRNVVYGCYMLMVSREESCAVSRT
jgi:hypothetical protein